MSSPATRILMHLSDGVITVRLTANEPQACARFPAAIAFADTGETFFFEEAQAVKDSAGVEFHLFDTNYLGVCSPIIVDDFIAALFDRKEVLEVVREPNIEKVLVHNFILRPDGVTTSFVPVRIRDSNLGVFGRSRSEEFLYCKSVNFHYGALLNLQPEFLNWSMAYSHRGLNVGPGFNDILNFFIKLLCLKGYDFTDFRGREFCRELVLEYCYVASDLDAEQEKLESKNGVLFVVKSPDGDEIDLGEECFLAPEILFQPELVGKQGRGVAAEVYSSLRTRGRREQRILLCGILVQKLEGFSKRLEKDIIKLSNGEISLTFLACESFDDGACTEARIKFHRNLDSF